MDSGDLTQNPIQFMETFQKCYLRLYKEHPHPSPSKLENVLQDVPLPKITCNYMELLQQPFSSEEVLEVIKTLKPGSNPGPNGFSVCYYKKFGPSLAPFMTQFLVSH